MSEWEDKANTIVHDLLYHDSWECKDNELIYDKAIRDIRTLLELERKVAMAHQELEDFTKFRKQCANELEEVNNGIFMNYSDWEERLDNLIKKWRG